MNASTPECFLFASDGTVQAEFAAWFRRTRERSHYPKRPPHWHNLRSADAGLSKYVSDIWEDGRVECPEEGVFEFERVCSCGAQQIILPDGAVVGETRADFPDLDRFAAFDMGAAARASRDPDALFGRRAPVAVFCKAGAGNYGHFLVEMLPRLFSLRRAGYRQVNLLLPNDSRPFEATCRAVARHLGLDAELAWVEGTETLFHDRLLYASPVSRHNARKSPTLIELRDVLAWIYQTSFVLERPDRLFVRRGASEKRRVVNAAGMEALFERRGFGRFLPAEAPLAAQIDRFACSGIVAGPLGAGLTNIMFCRPGAHVVMLDRGLYDHFFWDLANLFGLRFSWVFLDPITPFKHSDLWTEYAMDLDLVGSVLDRLGI